MKNDPRNIMPGTRVLVYDYRLFRDDVSTPLSYTMRPATVVARYGSNPLFGVKDPDPDRYPGGYDTWKYPDLVDVVFDHRLTNISHGHFTDGVQLL